MSVTWVLRSIAGLARCTRSPDPVMVGVKTSWPAARRSLAIARQAHPPSHPPCTNTNVAISPSRHGCHTTSLCASAALLTLRHDSMAQALVGFPNVLSWRECLLKQAPLTCLSERPG